MRNRTLRYWLGHLLMTATLFTQSALLWAQVSAPVQQPHQPMHHDCQSQQAHHMKSMKQQQCTQDCCSPEHACSSYCFSACVTPGMILLPTAAVSVYPYFHIPATLSASTLPRNGIHTTVLERPPRTLA